MIEFRPFRNSDPPHLCAIWQSLPPQRTLMRPMSPELLDHLVLAKLYFDPQGLIVAVDGGRPIGFVHAGFGASDDYQHLSHEAGATCMIMVAADRQRQGIGRELLRRAEAYLRERGAKLIYGGAVHPLNAFYLGLYGGSELPGVLNSHAAAHALFRSADYTPADRVMVLQRELAAFRPPVERRQMQLRRGTNLQVIYDPPAANWWDACIYGAFNRMRYELAPKTGGTPLGAATFWGIQPLSSSWGVQAAGLIDVQVNVAHQRQGVATYLLSESLKHLQREMVTLIETQTMQRNTSALGLYQKLGFELKDEGVVYRKNG